MFKFTIVLLLIMQYNAALAAPTNVKEIHLAQLLAKLARQCENKFISKQIWSRIEECNIKISTQYDANQIKCLSFYEISSRMCSEKSLIINDEMKQKLDEHINVADICNRAAAWKFDDLIAIHKDIFQNNSICFDICKLEFKMDDSSFFCKYNDWGYHLLENIPKHGIVGVKTVPIVNVTVSNILPENIIPPAEVIPPVNVNPPVDVILPADVIPPANIISPADIVPPADIIPPADIVPPASNVLHDVKAEEAIKEESKVKDVSTNMIGGVVKEEEKQRMSSSESNTAQNASPVIDKSEVKEDEVIHDSIQVENNDLQISQNGTKNTLNITSPEKKKEQPPSIDKPNLNDPDNYDSDDPEDEDRFISDNQDDADDHPEIEKVEDNKIFNKPKNNILETNEGNQEDLVFSRTALKDIYSPGDQDQFVTYLLTAFILVVLLYVLYHNKSKVTKVVLGLIVEGRQSGRRRNSRGHSYRRLDTLEQAISTNPSRTPTKIIY